MPVLDREPTNFTVGETVWWRRYIDDYHPSKGWNLSYSFRNFDSQFDITAVAKADHYLIELNSEDTSRYKAGSYWWQAKVVKDNQCYFIGSGEVTIKPNLSLLNSFDGRIHVKQVLDALEATILGKASRDQLSYSISGRSLSRLSPSELLEWRNLYKSEYARVLEKSG